MCDARAEQDMNIAEIQEQALAAIATASDESQLEEQRVALLGRKGVCDRPSAIAKDDSP